MSRALPEYEYRTLYQVQQYEKHSGNISDVFYIGEEEIKETIRSQYMSAILIQ